MVSLKKKRDLIEEYILQRAKIGYAFGDLEMKPVFDRQHNHFLLMVIGYEGIKYNHFALIDVEIRNDKIWIHFDGTESTITQYLLDNGIKNNEIVLGFHSPRRRKFTEFAVA
ncbi:MAG: XisI protein [Pyrinomonadaceae bacterium]|nr:XisI protein [Pyrinomonadaceae bacterium]